MTTTAPSRYATGDQIDALAKAHAAFASFLLDYRELAPVHPTAQRVYFHLPDKATLERFAASLELPVICTGGQWRAEKPFGPTGELTYVLWSEDLAS